MWRYGLVLRLHCISATFSFNILLLVGGVVDFRCPHGIAIYFKYTLRQESARDYVDAIMSFQKQPNVVVSDIADQVYLLVHHFVASKLQVKKLRIVFRLPTMANGGKGDCFPQIKVCYTNGLKKTCIFTNKDYYRLPPLIWIWIRKSSTV